MYSIQFSDWGLVLEFTGPISQNVVQDWLRDVRRLTGGFIEPFNVMLDILEARPVEAEVDSAMRQGLRVLKQAGMARAAIIVSSEHREIWSDLPNEAEMAGLQRIVASDGSAWEQQARAWVQFGAASNPDNASDFTVRNGT